MKFRYIVLIAFSLLQVKTMAQQALFAEGEKLTYEAYYGWITGANAVLELKKTTYNNDTLFFARASGYSVGMIDKLYQVIEIFDSYFSIDGNYLPVKAVENVSEGPKYKRLNVYLFDQQKNKVWSKTSGNHKVPDNTYDILSAFYYLRSINTSNLKPDELIRIQTFFQDEPWEMVIKYKGKETIKLGLGKIECLKFTPLVKKEGVFKDNDALSIWISNDKNKIPIRAQMDLMVGSFKVDLIKHTGLLNKLNFTK